MRTYEDIRTFLVRRPWLHGSGRLLSDAEYAAWRLRGAKPSVARIRYLSAFIDGWLYATGKLDESFERSTP